MSRSTYDQDMISGNGWLARELVPCWNDQMLDRSYLSQLICDMMLMHAKLMVQWNWIRISLEGMPPNWSPIYVDRY
jgi:hypothetical protein